METNLLEWLKKALSNDAFEELRTGKPLNISRHKTTKILNDPRKMNIQHLSMLYLFWAKQPKYTFAPQLPKIGTVLYKAKAGADVVTYAKYTDFYLKLFLDDEIESTDD